MLAVIFVWIWAFRLYFERYEYLHPDVTWALPGIDYKIVKVKGVLLWKEVPIYAPADGRVSYPQGEGPVRVGRGSVVTVMRTAGRTVEMKAYQQGYFIARSDGHEAAWRYAELWPGKEALQCESK